jgi:hypothetical protein
MSRQPLDAACSATAKYDNSAYFIESFFILLFRLHLYCLLIGTFTRMALIAR